ncbi:MAG: HmuY family protein [Syntrophothermus sp.]
MIRKIILLCDALMILMLVTSCFKEDEAIPRHPRGNVHTDTIGMTENYLYQVYFDLSDSAVRSRVVKTSTDFGFDSRSGGWQIILNTADFMKAADIGAQPFGGSYDTTGVHWKFDKSSGDPDSLALGRWFDVVQGDTVSNGHLYLINRGMDEVGNSLGLMQLMIDSLKNGTYYFRWAKINGSNPVSASVTRDPLVNFVWYSLSGSGSVQHPEPPEGSWDILFTQYTSLLFTDKGAAYPYLVTGVLLNRSGVSATVDSTHSFADINLEFAKSLTLKPNLDVIGYEWKTYSFSSGGYTVLPGLNYIIRDKAGYFYKLRFVGFYNSSGQKGYPVIEFQTL